MKKTFFGKLEAVAARMEREKGLDFFAIAHPIEGLYDRWDLLVVSPNLEPWVSPSLRYVAGLLQKALTMNEMVRIAQIVVLPRDHEIVESLLRNDRVRAGTLSAPLDDQFDRVLVIRPTVRQGRRRSIANARAE